MLIMTLTAERMKWWGVFLMRDSGGFELLRR
jgi:hypothetical protein